jgi:hypothetical protein
MVFTFSKAYTKITFKRFHLKSAIKSYLIRAKQSSFHLQGLRHIHTSRSNLLQPFEVLGSITDSLLVHLLLVQQIVDFALT